jgi:tetratricopeptide (TPR) repeat protein
MRRTLFAVALACCVASLPGALHAQGKVPKRPRLGNAADTNDARAYYNRGVELLERDPREAADAFYWASRIDPGFAEAFYARRVAGFMADERLLVRYLEGARGVYTSRDAQQLDTLEYRAQMLNPFFLRDLDRAFVARYIVAAVNQDLRRAGQGSLDPSQRHELDYIVEGYLRTGTSLRLRASLAASERRFPEALDLYRRAMSESRDRVGILVDRARVFFVTGVEDSALVQLREAVEELRRREADRIVRVYQSKEFFEHSIGMIHERQGDLAAAREAYGRALQENLSYYPAHVRLGLVALTTGDSATALSELDLATQVATKEATACLTYGMLLAHAGRLPEAEVQLRQAIELEPYYALPHHVLGQVAELQRNREQAIAAYRGFLARASQHDQRRADVTQRLADLGP